MHYLSIIAMFKNESTIIEQWIQHYLLEKVDHFYLIDNGSTDNYETIIKKYRNKITLVKDAYRQEKNTQDVLMNKHFLELIKLESKWAIICDIDEYIYNINNNSTIKKFLIDNNNNNIDKYWIPWKLFAAHNNPDIIPNNLKLELTMRKNSISNKNGFGKSIIKCEKLIKLETHNSIISGVKKILTLHDNLHCNHYKLISEKYFKNIKCIRGGGQSGFSNNYTINYFYMENKLCNEILDVGLKNKTLFLIKNFNYNSYRNNNNDLKKFKDNELWKHWLSYGIIENRKI